MIPHHSGAILIYEGASLQDQRIKNLCTGIKSSQCREIDQCEHCWRGLGTQRVSRPSHNDRCPARGFKSRPTQRPAASV
jgi:uncharacterized protein (DUF305 family)